VSPPVSGPVSTFKDVVLGGWISYVTFLPMRTREGIDHEALHPSAKALALRKLRHLDGEKRHYTQLSRYSIDLS